MWEASECHACWSHPGHLPGFCLEWREMGKNRLGWGRGGGGGDQRGGGREEEGVEAGGQEEGYPPALGE